MYYKSHTNYSYDGPYLEGQIPLRAQNEHVNLSNGFTDKICRECSDTTSPSSQTVGTSLIQNTRKATELWSNWFRN
jgi:hypothetical protein